MFLNPKVFRVIDGDTVELSDKRKVRLYGVDAPEKKQKYGMEAKEKLEHLALGKRVKIEIMSKDRYGRIVAKIFPCRFFFWRFDVAHRLIISGLAYVDPRYCKDKVYKELERIAKNKKSGVHGKRSVKPWDYRKKGSI